jgi:hypothetical protein
LVLVLSGAKKLGHGDYHKGQQVINASIASIIPEYLLHLVSKETIASCNTKLRSTSCLLINQDHFCEQQYQYDHNDHVVSELVKSLQQNNNIIPSVSMITQSGGLYRNYNSPQQQLVSQIYRHEIDGLLRECATTSESGIGGMREKLIYIKEILNQAVPELHLGNISHIKDMVLPHYSSKHTWTTCIGK